MPNADPAMRLVSFREVRHDEPDDCVHYESVAVRGQEMDWKIPAHRHEGLHQFQWLAKGRMQGSIDGAAMAVEAPALLMLAPGSVHAFEYARNAVGHQLTVPSVTLAEWLGGAQGLTPELGASAVLDAATLGGSVDEGAAAFEALAREFVADRPGRVHALRAHATLIALLFVRQHRESPAPGRVAGARDTLLKRYRALVERHYREQHALAFYAGALGVSVDHLSRSCRQGTGLSAQAIAHERLMLEARRMLAYTAMPVARIAADLGFEDPAYFSRFFSRAMGHSPVEYRSLVAQGIRSAAGP